MNARQLSIAVSGALFAVATAFAPAACAACKDCGTVTSVNTVEKKGEGSGLGMVLGGVAGGVLGHQVGSGRGKDVATAAGAAGGGQTRDHSLKGREKRPNHTLPPQREGGTPTDT